MRPKRELHRRDDLIGSAIVGVAFAVGLLAMVVLGADGEWTPAEFVLEVAVGGLAYLLAFAVLWEFFVRER